MGRDEKLQEILDRHDIWAVILRYARGIDRLDRDLVRSCYWDDAIDDHHVFVGRPDDFIDWAFGIVGKSQVSQHGLGNHSCELDGDNAHCETYYTAISARIDPPHMLSTGRYVDHFQRRGGVWKIANRVCTIEKLYSLGDHPADADSRAGLTSAGPPLPVTRDRSDLSYLRPVVPRQS